MPDNNFFAKVGEQYATYEQAYRRLVAASNDAQSRAKRAIFALHRGDLKDGTRLLGEAIEALAAFEPLFKKEPMLRYEGAYRAAIEESIEAHLFSQFIRGKSFGPIEKLHEVDAESHLGGLSDVTGELVRYAVARATARDFKEVKRTKQALDEVMAFLVHLDLTGYLRQKYDQARNSLRKMEEIAYDVALREK